MPEFISVLINSYNRAEQLRGNLELVFLQDYPADLFEIVVMDDASTDGTWEMLSGLAAGGQHPNLRIMRNDSNLEIVGCRQKLFQNLSPRSTVAILLDDDVSLPPGCLGKMAAYLGEHPEVGALGPRVVYAKNPDRTAHYPNFVNRFTGFYSSREVSEITDCDWLIACCLALRVEALARTAGLDIGFVNSHEEVDLCLRIKALGYKVVYYPLVKVRHDIGESKRKINRLYYLYRNKFLVIRKNFPFPWKVTATAAAVFLGFPKYIFESVLYNRGAVFSELKTITMAVLDGLLGRGGKFPR